jgi:hypothetical protein
MAILTNMVMLTNMSMVARILMLAVVEVEVLSKLAVMTLLLQEEAAVQVRNFYSTLAVELSVACVVAVQQDVLPLTIVLLRPELGYLEAYLKEVYLFPSISSIQLRSLSNLSLL